MVLSELFPEALLHACSGLSLFCMSVLFLVLFPTARRQLGFNLFPVLLLGATLEPWSPWCCRLALCSDGGLETSPGAQNMLYAQQGHSSCGCGEPPAPDVKYS